MTEDDVLAFIQASIKSVWALELLLLLRHEPERSWRAEELVRELRSSDSAVGEALAGLTSAGFVVADSDGRCRYEPASSHLDAITAGIAAVYAEKPLAVVKVIMRAPNEKLRIFSDAFKLKG